MPHTHELRSRDFQDRFFEPVAERRAWHLPVVVAASALAAIAASYSQISEGRNEPVPVMVFQTETWEADRLEEPSETALLPASFSYGESDGPDNGPSRELRAGE